MNGASHQKLLNEMTQFVPELAQRDSSLKVLQTRFLAQSAESRKRLLKQCQSVLGNPRISRDQALRVVAAKMLVACLPQSADVLGQILRTFDAGSYDVHFSVFVFLADAKHLEGQDGTVAIARDLMVRYLSEVRAPTGQAALMAGHALGGHFQDAKTIRLLGNLVATARYATGRTAAISGLAESLAKKHRPANKGFRNDLIRVAQTDRSSEVRAAARLALGKPYRHLRQIGKS